MEQLTTKQKFHLKKFIKELSNYKARHTEFISVYIPQGYEMNKIISHLQQEQGTAANIKSSSTKKNVIDALERMIQHLRLFNETPLNGLAVFSGNIASAQGGNDLKVWSVEPPAPLKTRMYRCDKTFVLDLLFDMLETKEVYGLVVMDRRDAIIAFLRGKTIIPLVKTHSHVPGKFKAGGQSAHRFEMNRELAAKAHYKKVAEHMKTQFLGYEGLKGILVGGPGPTKHEFVDGNYITADVKKKIITVKDLSYTEEFGLQELVDKSGDVLFQEDIVEEKKIVNQFLETLAKRPGLISYGEKEVMKALEMGAVATLLLSESLDESKIETFEETAKKFSTEIKIISTETMEGAQLRDLGGYGAILRYELSV